MHGHFRTLAIDLLKQQDKRAAGIRQCCYESHDVGSSNRGIPAHDRDGIVRVRIRRRRLKEHTAAPRSFASGRAAPRPWQRPG